MSTDLPSNELTGLVLRSVGARYRVQLPSGELIEATLRGKLRMLETRYRATNPVAVGDQVYLLEETGGWVIAGVVERHNHMLRKAVKQTSEVQVLAANIDQALMVAALKEPYTSLGYIDRFLVMCEAYHIPAVVCFNKIDNLTSEKELGKLDDFSFIYELAGYPVLQVSSLQEKYREQVLELLQGKVTFLAGSSGAGKSTLINLADPSLQLRTGEISKHTGKGKHTTTFAEMHHLSFGGYVIDAPGFREFDIVDITPEELGGYFPEFRKLMPACKFNNCTHVHEPGCAVREAYENESISDTRYHTYLSMLESLINPPKR